MNTRIDDKLFENSTKYPKPVSSKTGFIYTSFPEAHSPDFEGITDFPVSYCKLTAKERLLLLYAENFRRQYWEKYPKRKLPVLAVQNECGVQKFVSTTIRTTPLIFAEMIGNWQENAAFVADFIEYEPLDEPCAMPNRLISPDTLLKRRKGNSFEIATLLCSLLIGTGFSAYVVSGYATREITTNDQKRVVCPNIPVETTEISKSNELFLPMLRESKSKFLVEKERMEAERQMRQQKRIDDEILARRRSLEKLEPDKYFGRRTHAWVAVTKTTTENVTSVFFIEPSTGFRFECTEPTYLGIESVWNHNNYYINRQEPITDISNMSWNFKDIERWEHFLQDECFEEDSKDTYDSSSQEKYLDMPFSWVRQLYLTHAEFEERFPNGEKSIHYMRTRYERFAPFKNKDGLVTRLTTFETLDYEQPLLRWEWYGNRADLLYLIKVNYVSRQIEEYFTKGRCDSLKYYTILSENNEKIFEFYHTTRTDSLMKLEVQPDYIRQHFNSRRDCLYFREFKIQLKASESSMIENKTDIVIEQKTQSKDMVAVFEKFERNKAKNYNEDIAVRHLTENEIFIQYHYAADRITATTRTFTKPPKPDYGCEISFDMVKTEGYNACSNLKEPSQVELYLLFLSQLNEEERCRKDFKSVCKDIDELLHIRHIETVNPQLKFSIFDPLRNEAARRIRMAKYEMLKEQHEIAMRSDPDYVAPYLIIYDKNEPLNFEISEIIFHQCLEEFKATFQDVQRELEFKLAESETESRQFKKFFVKYENQFSEEELERFTAEGENIEIDKAVIKHRLKDINEQFDVKFENVKKKLLNDSRLNFSPNFIAMNST